MPLYDCGDKDCEECQRAFGPNREKATTRFEAREAFYGAECQTYCSGVQGGEGKSMNSNGQQGGADPRNYGIPAEEYNRLEAEKMKATAIRAAVTRDERETIAKGLFYQAMAGHARWDDLTEPNKNDWLVRADAILALTPKNLDIRSFSQSTKDSRCLEVWFGSDVTDADRAALLRAVNLSDVQRMSFPALWET